MIQNCRAVDEHVVNTLHCPVKHWAMTSQCYVEIYYKLSLRRNFNSLLMMNGGGGGGMQIGFCRHTHGEMACKQKHTVDSMKVINLHTDRY